MRKRISRWLLPVCVASPLLAVPAFASAQTYWQRVDPRAPAPAPVTIPKGAEGEQVLTDLPEGFVLGWKNTDSRGNDIIELIPKGETLQKWTQMATVNIANSSAHVSPREHLGIIETGWAAACPNSSSEWVREGLEQARPVAYLILACPKNPATGEMEVTYLKGIQGERAFYVVQRAFRHVAGDEDITKAVTWLMKARLCNDARGVACPK